MINELQLAFTETGFLGTLAAIIGAVVLLIIGLIVGRAVGKGIRLLLNRIGVDSLAKKAGIGDTIEETGWSIAKFFDVTVRWLIYIVFIMAAVDVLNIEFMSNFMNELALFFPRIFAAAIVLLVGATLTIIASKWVEGTLETNEVPLANIIAPILKAIMIVVVLVLAMDQLLMDMTIIYAFIVPLAWGIGIGIGVAIGVSVGLGSKEAINKYMNEKLEERKKGN